ncbi:MAG TPA: DUF2924 domain-containing protein [Gemmataceae bacterium]|nr:DUF2924 domain-containing protein [Gemmataceae bacterium]
MNPHLAHELTALRQLTVAGLRARYGELFGEETHVGNKLWLIRRIAWRLQALAEGDLSQRARQRAAELARDADVRLSPPRSALLVPAPAPPTPSSRSRRQPHTRLPAPGTILTRPYKGETLQVRVLRHGLEFEGTVYPSLSAVAKAITGSHCSGHLFFRLKGVAS